MDAAEMDLFTSIELFGQKISDNKDVLMLLKNWSPNIIIESYDSKKIFTLKIGDQGIENIALKEELCDHEIRLLANETILLLIFSGKMNPAEAVFNGELEIYGDVKDQIKLDAITLLIWGV